VPITKDAILKPRPAKTELVPCPEWGDVLVKALSGAERDQFEAGLTDNDGQRDLTNMRARLLVLAIVGEDGKPLLAPEDVSALGGQPAAEIDRCFQVAKRLAGIGEEKSAEKNSGRAASGDSVSASPPT
jgi:hypothetical protein